MTTKLNKYHIVKSYTAIYPDDETMMKCETFLNDTEIRSMDNDSKLVEITRQDDHFNETVIIGQSCNLCKWKNTIACIGCSLHYESKFKEVQK